MSGLVDRYTPSEPYPRLIVPTVAAAAFLSLFALFAISAVNRPGPVTDVHVSFLVVPFALFLAFVASARVAQIAVRDVADRASAADRRSTSEPTDATEAGGDATDPVATIQRRYATGELTEAELDRKIDRLLEADRSDGTGGDTGTERVVE